MIPAASVPSLSGIRFWLRSGNRTCHDPVSLSASHRGAVREQVKLELETGLSAITSSYERTMNLKSAVEENIDNLKPPVKGLFQSFLVEISVINPDVKAAICHLRERVKDCVWEEWCDTLISCQDDSQLIGTLYPVVEKLTDMRIVNAELKVMISENKREYYIMALMVVANIRFCISSTKSGTERSCIRPSARSRWQSAARLCSLLF